MILMGLGEAAAELHCSERWLADNLRAGRFPAKKIGRKWILSDGDIAAILKICSVRPAAFSADAALCAAPSSSMTKTRSVAFKGGQNNEQRVSSALVATRLMSTTKRSRPRQRGGPGKLRPTAPGYRLRARPSRRRAGCENLTVWFEHLGEYFDDVLVTHGWFQQTSLCAPHHDLSLKIRVIGPHRVCQDSHQIRADELFGKSPDGTSPRPTFS